MCSVELTEREKQIRKFYWDEGKTKEEIRTLTGLSKSSVKTYIYSIIRKLKLDIQDAIEVKVSKEPKKDGATVFKDTEAGNLYSRIPHELLANVRTFSQFKDAVNSITDVPESLEERVEAFKIAYCAACTVKHMCKECPNKLLWEKYLY